jgi:hypothetical protein
MGRALKVERQKRCWAGLMVAGLMATVAMPVQAYRNAACLLTGRIEQVERQPLHEVVLHVLLQDVSDNNVHANEVECGKVFSAGSRLWISLHESAFTSGRMPRVSEQAWLSLRYMGGSAILRKYEWMTRETYLERKDGIQ